MTGGAYIGEVLIQIWLKSMKKSVSYIDKQLNVQKESFRKTFGFTQAPASPQKSVR